MKYIIVLLLLCVAYVYATSSGTNVNICDVYSPLFGCNPDFWVNGDRLKCMNTSNVMSWASQPVRTDAYRLFVGDENNPSTEYTPDGLVTVSIRVMYWGMQYRGLLLYAINDAGEKVGDWEIVPETPNWMHKPWMSGDCEKAVLHAGAEWKPSLFRVKFRGPPAGTGPVTMQCLIKYGDANKGDFFWPNAEGDLVLTEGTPADPQVVFQAELGQSCREYCVSKGEYCDVDALDDIREHNVDELLSTHHACKLPYLSSCDDVGATRSEDGHCYYVGDAADCSSRDKAEPVPSCEAKSNNPLNGRRLCVCTSERPSGYVDDVTESDANTDANTNANTDDGSNTSPVSSGRMISVNLVYLCCFFGLVSGKRSSVFVALCLGLLICNIVPGAEGHNWLNSPSRSPIANTLNPSLPKQKATPHVQVTDGQDFIIEWASSHWSPFHIAVVRLDLTLTLT